MTKLRFLFLEANPLDAERVERALQDSSIDCKLLRVASRSCFVAALETEQFDLILADYKLPDGGITALEIAGNFRPEVPFIFVVDSLDEEVGIAVLERAAGFVLKHRLERLAPCIQRALQQAQERRDRQQTEWMLVEQKRLLELIASGHPLEQCLTAVCASISSLNPHSRACFLLTDAQRQTFPCAIAPDFLPSFGQGLKDAPINDLCIGTCGEAVYRGQPITCPDIADDDRWSQEWRDLCVTHGISACHSQPVMGMDGLPLGSLMLCLSEARMPTDWEYQLANFGAQVASIAFERDRSNFALRESEAKYRSLFESIDEGFCICEMLFDDNGNPQDYRFLEVNPVFTRLTGLQQAVGKTARELVANLEAFWVETYGKVVQTGEAVRFEQQSVIMNRWFDVNAFCIGEPQNHQFGILFTNISDRKQAEQERERFLAVGSDLQVITGNNGYFQWVSPSFESILGWTSAEMTAHPWTEFVHPDDMTASITEADSLFSGSETFRFENRYRHKDGSYRWLLWNTQSYPEKQVLYGTAIDITEHKRAEIALQQNEEQSRQILESLSEAFFALDENWLFTYVNQTAATLLGRAPSDLIGKNCWEEFPGLNGSAFEQMHRRVANQRVAESLTAFYPDHNRWYEVRTYPVANGITFYFRDVSDRIQAEAAIQESKTRLDFVLEAAQFGDWDLDLRDHTATRSLKHDQIFGYESLLPEWTYEMFLSHVLPDERAEVDRKYQMAVAENGAWNLECRICRVDQNVRWIWLLGYVYVDAEGEAIRMVGLVSDITARKQAEELARRDAEINAFRVSLTDALRPLANPLDVQAIASRMLGEYINVNRVVYFEVHGSDYVVEQDYVNGAEALAGCYPIESFGAKLLNAYQTGRSVSAADVASDANLSPEQQSAYAAIQIGAYIGIPLVKDGEFVAGLAVHAASPRVWTPDEIALAEEVAERTWAAVERARAEIALREALVQLESALAAGAVYTWSWNVPANRIIVNAAFANLFGVDPARATTEGLPAEDFINSIHEEDRSCVFAAIQQAIETGEVYMAEHRVHTATGEMRWLTARGQVKYDATGKAIAFPGALADITERKWAEEDRDRFFQISHDMLAIAHMDGYFLHVNPAWTETLGYAVSELVGQPYIEFVHPDDQAATLAEAAKIAQGNPAIEFENRYRAQDGSYHWISWSVAPFVEQKLMYCVARDVTDRKQIEIELRQKNAILDVINQSAPTPIFVKDRQGRIIYANPATLEAVGKSAAEVIGYRDGDFYPNPEDAARVMENDRRIMESGQMEIVEESPDGVRTFLGMKVPYRNELGEVIGLIGISNDITDRVQIERDRERILHQEQAAREAAENANRIKDEFLAVLSHELRSPLNPILGWTRLLQNGKLDAARQTEALATIERNAKLQTQLIEDLLDISRIMQGKLTLTAAPVSLTFVISGAVETVRLAAEAKQIQILLDLNTGGASVSGDAARLQQVVWNLLTNAIKFTPNGGQVTVELRQLNQLAQIRVTDTGKGISPDFLPHVFEYFRQADATTTRKFGGLGLGLAIVRQIVEMHGGTVQTESLGENQGATFTVQLPIMQQAISAGAESPHAPAGNTEMPLNNLQILVVDDNADTREFQTFLLEQNGAKVTAVASGLEALQMLDRCIPDVIVSDVGMAEMDGYMLMQQIRSRPPNQGGQIPAIALTAYARDFDQQKALQAGFQAHITKPVEPEALTGAISMLLSQTHSSLTQTTLDGHQQTLSASLSETLDECSR